MGETADALASAPPEGKSHGGKVPGRSAMVFSGFISNRLDQVLSRLHSVDPRNQAMKAVVIETNHTQAFREFLHELTREREVIHRRLQEQQDKTKAGQEQSE